MILEDIHYLPNGDIGDINMIGVQILPNLMGGGGGGGGAYKIPLLLLRVVTKSILLVFCRDCLF